MTFSPNILTADQMEGFSALQHRSLLNSFMVISGSDGLTAHAGGNQTNALLLTSTINRVTTVATPGDSVALPTSTAGLSVIVINDTSNAMQVFGSGTDTINDVATATGVSQLANTTVYYACSIAGKWYSIALTSLLPTNSYTDSITAHAGGNQTNATPLTTKLNRVTTVATAGDSIKLPASVGGLEVTVINAASNAMQVFGAGTDTINGVATATGVTQLGNSTMTYRCTTAGNWTTSLVLQSGDSGVAGGVQIFPGTASKGYLNFTATANTGNTATTVTNSAMGQASTISIPDPGASTDTFALLGTNNTFTGTNQINTLNVGASGTAGTVTVYPSTAANGTIVLSATNNSNNHSATITNATVGQNTTYTIPDPGASSANFVLSTTANGTESSNAVTASGYSGFITTSSLNTGGGANYSITWTNTKIASTSRVLLTLNGGTNTTQNFTFKCTPGSSTATLVIYNNTAATAFNGTFIIGYQVLP